MNKIRLLYSPWKNNFSDGLYKVKLLIENLHVVPV